MLQLSERQKQIFYRNTEIYFGKNWIFRCFGTTETTKPNNFGLLVMPKQCRNNKNVRNNRNTETLFGRTLLSLINHIACTQTPREWSLKKIPLARDLLFHSASSFKFGREHHGAGAQGAARRQGLTRHQGPQVRDPASGGWTVGGEERMWVEWREGGMEGFVLSTHSRKQTESK